MAAITDYPPFDQPRNDDYVWRYFDFPYFLDFMINKKLFFSRLDQFEDRFEASLGIKNYDDSELMKILNGLSSDCEERWRVGRDTLLNTIKKQMYVSCWHLNNTESMAMWKIYGRTQNTVAIKCKYSELVESISDSNYIGKIRYYNYLKDKVEIQNIFFPVMHKRNEYAYENEVRIVK